MTRDPRINPVAGDEIERRYDGYIYRVVQKVKVSRRVTAVDYVCASRMCPITESVSLTSWRRMMKGSKVLRQAEVTP